MKNLYSDDISHEETVSAASFFAAQPEIMEAFIDAIVQLAATEDPSISQEDIVKCKNAWLKACRDRIKRATQ